MRKKKARPLDWLPQFEPRPSIEPVGPILDHDPVAAEGAIAYFDRERGHAMVENLRAFLKQYDEGNGLLEGRRVSQERLIENTLIAVREFEEEVETARTMREQAGKNPRTKADGLLLATIRHLNALDAHLAQIGRMGGATRILR